MHQLLWKSLFALLVVCALWHTFLATQEYLSYRQLAEKKLADIQAMRSVSATRRAYTIEADYRFEHEGKHYEGKGTLAHELFRNRWASEERIRALEGKQLAIYFSPSKPELSNPSRVFPYRLIAYSLVLYGLILYFCWLKTQLS